MQLEIGKSKLHLIYLVSKKKKKVFLETNLVCTFYCWMSHLSKKIKNTEMAIKILKNGKKNTESTEPRLEALQGKERDFRLGLS